MLPRCVLLPGVGEMWRQSMRTNSSSVGPYLPNLFQLTFMPVCLSADDDKACTSAPGMPAALEGLVGTGEISIEGKYLPLLNSLSRLQQSSSQPAAGSRLA